MASSNNKQLANKIVEHYLKYDKDNPFIFISAMMALFGIASGVMVMIIAIGITNGIQKHFKETLFVMNYPLTIVSDSNGVDKKVADEIKYKFPQLKLSPYYVTQVVNKNRYGIQGSIVYGVDFDKEVEVNQIFAKTYKNNRAKIKYSVIIGNSLSKQMNIKQGEKLLLYFSKQQPVGLGTIPLQKRFLVDGIFDSGIQSYDAGIIYTTHQALQSLLGKKKYIYDGIHIYTDKPMKIIDEIRKILPKNTGIEGWWQKNGNLFVAMQMEKKVYFLILLFIILIASLNIISSLLMTVMSRRSEIALLQTLGATKKEIKNIFYKLGFIIGAIGITLGSVLGFVGIWMLETFDIITLPEDVYGISKLPVVLPLGDFISITLGSIIIILVSSVYPAKKASSTNPMSVLRSE